jgi:glycosyl transferase family 25
VKNNQIPVYVINLARSPERLQSMQNQCDSLGIEFEKIEAIDGNNIAGYELEAYKKESKKSNKHYAVLNNGEIGCAMSWHKVWKIFYTHTDNSFCVVGLEDDIKLKDNFVPTSGAIKWKY